MHFLERQGSSLLTLTRRNISAFVEYEQDRGLKVVSIISHLRVIYAFVAYLVRQEVIAPEIMKPKVRMQEPDALPKAIPGRRYQVYLRCRHQRTRSGLADAAVSHRHADR